jgi:hypothetical protein
MGLVDAARLRTTTLEITVPASIAIAAKRAIAGLPPAPGPAAEAWGTYRDILFAVLDRFESWEFREGGDLDPTYTTLEHLCERATARAAPRWDPAAAALICTGPLSELQERCAPRRHIRTDPVSSPVNWGSAHRGRPVPRPEVRGANLGEGVRK